VSPAAKRPSARPRGSAGTATARSRTATPKRQRRGGSRPRPLTVAITGPTGDIGMSLLRALDRTKEVGAIRGMARRPFDPAAAHLKKVSYVQGDVTKRADVERFVKGADVVVHLAFVIFGGLDESRAVNLEGSRNVFEATIAAGVKRLVYASSVAAYGFHDDNPDVLTEEIEPRGTDGHYYSAQKAELEGLLAGLLQGSRVDAYVFRPCIVAGPDALLLIENIPYVRLGGSLPGVLRRLFDTVPMLRPVIPDNGVPFQLVHQDDVAAAMRAAVLGRGVPGVYNLAGDGTLQLSDLADALGWYSVPLPELAVDATAEIVARLPFAPAEASWINALRKPVLMDTAKARRELRWRPRHDARETLSQMVAGARAEQLIR
jgi:nucleoside-diphosphate-sugar epimerase